MAKRLSKKKILEMLVEIHDLIEAEGFSELLTKANGVLSINKKEEIRATHHFKMPQDLTVLRYGVTSDEEEYEAEMEEGVYNAETDGAADYTERVWLEGEQEVVSRETEMASEG